MSTYRYPVGRPHQSRPMRKVEPGRPAWWAASAVPYRYFWLLPSAGVVIGLAAASALRVPLWLALICAEAPALTVEHGGVAHAPRLARERRLRSEVTGVGVSLDRARYAELIVG